MTERNARRAAALTAKPWKVMGGHLHKWVIGDNRCHAIARDPNRG